MSGHQSAGAAVETEVQQPVVKPSPRARPQNDAKPKRLPPHSVILHDDPINGFGFVIRTLKKVFHYNTAHAFLLTLRAHRTGRAAVWTAPRSTPSSRPTSSAPRGRTP